jgi:predicted transcriptional regulator
MRYSYRIRAMTLGKEEINLQLNEIELTNVFEIKKRSFLQIVAEILTSLLANPIKKTHISFKCNLMQYLIR